MASFRLRCLQIMPALQKRDLACTLWEPGAPTPEVLILSKRYDPASVRIALELREQQGCKLVLDLCDNHFFAAIHEEKWASRKASLVHAIQHVDAVIASTEYLKDVIRQECGDNTPMTVIGDALDTPQASNFSETGVSFAFGNQQALFRKLSKITDIKARRLLWFGNHGSPSAPGGIADLQRIKTELHQAHSNAPLHLTIMSNHRLKYMKLFSRWSIPMAYIKWDKHSFSNYLWMHGTCILPIQSNPFTMAKTNNRVATALVHGLNVIADPIPSYLELAPFIEFGNWSEGLKKLGSEGSRHTSASARSGAQYVIQKYGVDVISQRWAELLAMVSAGQSSQLSG